MSKKTQRYQFTVNIRSIEDVPGSFIGGEAAISWAKGKRAKDKGTVPPVKVTSKKLDVNSSFSFSTRIFYDDTKQAYEKKFFKLKVKSTTSESQKPRLVGKEKLDLSKFCGPLTDQAEEISLTLSDKKSNTCTVFLQFSTKSPTSSKRKSLSSSQNEEEDETSISEMTEFDEVSTEDESLTTSEFTTPEPDEKKKRTKRVSRSITVGPHDTKQKVTPKFSDDTITAFKTPPGNKSVRITEPESKEIAQLKELLETHVKTIDNLKQELVKTQESLKRSYEQEISLTSKIEALESTIQSLQKESTLLSPSEPYYKPAPPTEEEMIALMVLLVIFLIFCVVGEIQRLLF